MRWLGITHQGESKELPSPLRMRLEKSLFTPAHAFFGEFAADAPAKEIKTLQGFAAGQMIFDGLVDEQSTACSAKGTLLSVSARSRAALLLDNEAIPRSYRQPSLADIIQIHCAPYGLSAYRGAGSCPAEFTVSKGMTEWGVLERFCRSVIGVYPRILDDGTIDASGQFSGKKILISNQTPGGLRFFSAKAVKRRYGIVSEVKYKLSSSSDYTYSLINGTAEEEGICARRLVNLGGNPDWMNRYLIDRKIRDSMRDRFFITAMLPGILLPEIGTPAAFLDDVLGEYREMAVSGVVCRCSAQGVETIVTLHPPGVLLAKGEEENVVGSTVV